MSNLFYIKFKTTHAVYGRPFKGEVTLAELQEYIKKYFLNGPDEKFISIISIEELEKKGKLKWYVSDFLSFPQKKVEETEDLYKEFKKFCESNTGIPYKPF